MQRNRPETIFDPNYVFKLSLQKRIFTLISWYDSCVRSPISTCLRQCLSTSMLSWGGAAGITLDTSKKEWN